MSPNGYAIAPGDNPVHTHAVPGERFLRSAFVSLCLIAVAAGCGDDDADPVDAFVPADRGVPRDSGPEPDMGCEHTGPPVFDPNLFPACPLCENARCVRAVAVPSEFLSFLQDCDEEGQVCVPDGLIASGGDFTLASCRSVGGMEGRCVSNCIPWDVSDRLSLPVDSCGDDERCVPCFDPETGADTGACELSCDPGPAEASSTLDACCGDTGFCVAPESLGDEEQVLFGMDTCGDGLLCEPNAYADEGHQPPSCTTGGSAEGRCLPACVPLVAERADSLAQDDCAEGLLCTPCFDARTGEATGACDIRGDEPAEAGPTACCADAGVCVASALLSTEERSLYGADGCADGALCALTAYADTSHVAASCRSHADGEGRCLPSCLPLVAERADDLPAADCGAGELCAPCFDPLTGEATGACSVGSDEPAEAATLYAGCCDLGGTDRGRCIPPAALDTANDGLPQDTCATGETCVPDPWAADPTATMTPCTTAGTTGSGASGACVPDCLASLFDADVLAQSTCGSGEVCAPCMDGGSDTGVCR